MNPPTILIIDDSIEDLRALVRMLRSAGYRLIISTNGVDGCRRALAFNPDLILLDVRMPRMDGFSVCRLLKAGRGTADIPVIFLTAASDPESRLEGLRIGGADYVSKPALPEEVLLRIGIHLQYRRAHAKHSDLDTVQAKSASQHPDDLLVDAAIKVMETDLSVTTPIDDLARKVGSSRKRLTDVFRRKYGCTAANWLRERRMLLAKQWLAETSMTVHQISDSLGYNSPANFATAFKERFGMQPREWRGSSRDQRIAMGRDEQTNTSGLAEVSAVQHSLHLHSQADALSVPSS